MIFLSYASVERELACQLHDELTAHGFPVWVDYLALDLSEDIRPQLVNAVQASEILLLLASPASLASPWVGFELSLCRHYQKAIVPVKASSNRHRLISSAFSIDLQTAVADLTHVCAWRGCEGGKK